MDARYTQLAEIMAGYSTQVEDGDQVLLMSDVNVPFDMKLAVIEAVRRRGGVMLAPHIWDQRLLAATRIGCTPRSLSVDADAYLTTIQDTDVRISLRGYMNPFEFSSVPPEDKQRYNKYYTAPVLEESLKNDRWVVTSWPTSGFATIAGLSTTEAENVFFRAVLADYPSMQRAAQPLKELMDRTKDVHVRGPSFRGGHWNLRFRIDGIGAVACTGQNNLPDGEAYTAPVRDSVNGTIEFNTLTISTSGDQFEDVWFVVRDGKIVESGCQVGDPKRIEQILNTDEGARYFGEWALGLNWDIPKVFGDTLFDEKIGGTFHLTPGKAHQKANNGNQSGVHWDIVCDQRESAGGGEVYFDGKLVRLNGIFVLDELAGLNPPRAEGKKTAKPLEVNQEAVRQVLSAAFDPTIGPLRPEEVNEDAVQQILAAATDPTVGPVRPEEVNEEVVGQILRTSVGKKTSNQQ